MDIEKESLLDKWIYKNSTDYEELECVNYPRKGGHLLGK